jgi:hypothetical protein
VTNIQLKNRVCRTRIRISGYLSNPNPGAGGRIFEIPFTGPDYPHTLLTQYGLAVTYGNLGQLQTAAELFEDTVQRRKEGPVLDHPVLDSIPN